MENHIKAAWAHWALSWLYGAFALIILLVFFLYPGDETSPLTIVFVLPFLGGLFALHQVIAKGSREKRSWARSMSKGIGVLMLLGFPIGTLIGIYLLSNSWHVWEGGNT